MGRLELRLGDELRTDSVTDWCVCECGVCLVCLVCVCEFVCVCVWSAYGKWCV